MRSRRLIRRAALRIASPLLQRWYAAWNSRERRVRADGFDLVVLPGVFHADLFNSTRLLAEHVKSLQLEGRTFLDLGTGSGRIGLTAARAGAIVTASDVNPAAVACAERNALHNGLPITARVSDLFDALPGHFDVIAINPPYYDRDPVSASEHAFFAGKGLRYFERLFAAMGPRIANGTETWLVLSEDLDLEQLGRIARAHGLRMSAVRREQRWGETSVVLGLLPLVDP